MPKTTATRFRILSITEVTDHDPFGIECVVVPKARLDAPVEKLSSYPSRWHLETLSQYKEKKARIAGDSSLINSCVRVNLSTGAHSTFFFVDPDCSTFQLHQDLRKNFLDVFDGALLPQTSRIRFDLRSLDQNQTDRILLALSVLSLVSTWKPESFGKKRRKDLKGSTRSKNTPIPIEVVLPVNFPADIAKNLILRGQCIAQANNLVRTLAVRPANDLNPERYRNTIQSYCRQNGLKYQFLDLPALRRLNAGAFLAVTRADEKAKSGIACVTYTPKSKSKSKTKKLLSISLVGKGICFDTGGYNVKTGGYMLGMHGDMTGSALALALTGMFAQLNVDFEVRAYLALAENLISPTAYKPNEVVEAMDGTAIEVVDTDAEGRMILADTLAYASRQKPDLMIDFATLTGAAIRSLDTRRSAVFSNRSDLADLAVRAGDLCGERTWSFPIGQDYREELNSKIADIVQCAPGNNADQIYAATFLSEFVAKDIPWVHLDLVAAENKGGLGLVSTDTSGFGVLWAEQLIRLVFNRSP